MENNTIIILLLLIVLLSYCYYIKSECYNIIPPSPPSFTSAAELRRQNQRYY